MKQIDVAIAIIQRAGKALISQRREGDAFAHLWEFPGGKVETGETPRQCIIREIREELGVNVRIDSPLAVIDHAYSHLSVRLFPFLCSIESGEPMALASQRLEWAGADDLPSFAFPAANACLVQEIISLLANPV